jgi:hypothetical protein
MIIVAMGHRKRVGKDTLAKYINTYLRTNYAGINVRIVGFADRVKDVAFLMYSWAGLQRGSYYEEANHERERENILPLVGRTPRQIWIDVGQALRKQDDACWLNCVLMNKTCDVCLVKDIRFPTEVEGVEREGGILIEVENDRVPYIPDEADEPLENKMWYHYKVLNNGSHSDLNAQAEYIVQTFIASRLNH